MEVGLTKNDAKVHNRDVQRTALYDRHIFHSGRMVPFAGFEMPVQYTGVLAEARAVRAGVGVFDVSHMGRLLLSGPDATADLRRLVTCEIADLEIGRGRYGLLLNESGGTVDDLIVFREADERWALVVNASNHAKDAAWIAEHLSPTTRTEDITARTVLIAVQGPAAASLLARIAADPEALVATPSFGMLATTLAGARVGATRSGYTGEDGFEIVAFAEDGPRLWERLVEEGATPCGLAARDALRVEAGLPLYGHELGEELSPLDAGLGWAIRKHGGHVGAEAIAARRATPGPRRLVGLKLAAKRLVPEGASVSFGDRIVGATTSGVVSPLLDTAIAMAFVDRDVPFGAEAAIELRGVPTLATVSDKRFFRRAKP